METLQQLVKAAYPLTNRRQFIPQIIHKLQHVESVCLFSHYMQYMVPSITSGILEQHASEGKGDGDGDGNGDGNGNGDGDGDGDSNIVNAANLAIIPPSVDTEHSN